MEKKKILVAMSGGVDSSVAAGLLKEAGYEIAGATIRTWASNHCSALNTKACCGLSGVEDAREVADQIGIPYWVLDFEKEFKERVVDYFAAEYMKGRTPNPCIACNEHIKFRLFLKRARELGYEAIATGHYAQVLRDPGTENFCIREGVDPGKDQSYVLFPLDREVLSNLYLPVGGFTKEEIRAKARSLGLRVASKPDSQEICFIPSHDYGRFLEREYPEKQTGPGVIRTRDGRVLGRHDGYFHYTRGQRRGLGVAHTERLYVIETIPETNEVIVGTREEIRETVFYVKRVNWFLKPEQTENFEAQVKIRSQHEKAPARLSVLEDESVKVVFETPEEAITPGQAAVFYEGPKVIAGGWIDRVE